jgi:transposase
MKKVAKTLLGHRELILNYFTAEKHFSSGVIGGVNNKLLSSARACRSASLVSTSTSFMNGRPP